MDLDMLVLYGSAGLGAVWWYQWYHPFRQYGWPTTPLFRWLLIVLQLTPPLCLALTWIMLSFYAAWDVRGVLFYMLEYLALGGFWLALAQQLFPFLGLSAAHDFLDRRNLAAFPALVGALLGLTFCYIGSNIGDGPGFYVVVFCAGLATLVFYLLWWLTALLSEVDYTITVERDASAGLRLGGLLAALGLIIGRAAAGNWIGYGETIWDMLVYGLPPALMLTLLAILFERVLRPTPQQPEPKPLLYGIGPLLLYLLMATGYVLFGIFPA